MDFVKIDDDVDDMLETDADFCSNFGKQDLKLMRKMNLKLVLFSKFSSKYLTYTVPLDYCLMCNILICSDCSSHHTFVAVKI